MIKSVLRRSVRLWLPIAAAVTVICGLVYAESQGALREAANDPQIQMAEDTASSLAAGTPAASSISGRTVDIASSLAPFLIVYDTHNAVVASSASLNGVTPNIAAGVLSSARTNGEDRVTWEPAPGVRIAAVVVTYSNGDVLAGRSLREVEVRESNALAIAAAGWLAAEVAVGVTIFAVELAIERRRFGHSRPN
jgi:hypothetical protein